jgi:hypothetical protein
MSSNMKSSSERKRAQKPKSQPKPSMKPAESLPRAARRGARYSGDAGLVDYILSPFKYASRRLGLGTMLPTELATVSARATKVPTNTHTAFAIVYAPQAKSIVRFFSDVASSTTLTGSAVNNAQDSPNQAAITAAFNSARPTSAGMKVTARYTQTSLPGQVYVGILYDSLNDIIGQTYDQLVLNPELKQLEPDSGTFSCNHPWLYGDVLQTTMQPGVPNATGITATSSWPYLVVVGQGFVPANFNYSYDAIGHLEGLSGVDSPIDESTGGGGQFLAKNVTLEGFTTALTRAVSSFASRTATEHMRRAAGSWFQGG